jgi:hypothetical protein
MHAHVSVPVGSSGRWAVGFDPAATGRIPLPATGGELLALAMSLRARGLRGLDVLRRSQDRAPPEVR